MENHSATGSCHRIRSFPEESLTDWSSLIGHNKTKPVKQKHGFSHKQSSYLSRGSFWNVLCFVSSDYASQLIIYDKYYNRLWNGKFSELHGLYFWNSLSGFRWPIFSQCDSWLTFYLGYLLLAVQCSFQILMKQEMVPKSRESQEFIPNNCESEDGKRRLLDDQDFSITTSVKEIEKPSVLIRILISFGFIKAIIKDVCPESAIEDRDDEEDDKYSGLSACDQLHESIRKKSLITFEGKAQGKPLPRIFLLCFFEKKVVF